MKNGCALCRDRLTRFIVLWLALLLLWPNRLTAQETAQPEVNDSHLHLTNYIQEGTDIHKLLEIMGTKVGHAALFGIPLQQQWSYRNSGNRAPTYYLESDSPLYYYSFTDAWIAMAYKSLTKEEQARFDPMITGFNPSDMYAVDHIKRVLTTFPGVFTGIGEFSVHKEFVSAKIAGEVASLEDPALDRILDFCADSGLLVIIHNDMDTPFPRPGQPPGYLEQMRSLIRRHPKTTIIWAHTGLGRVVQPVQGHAAVLEDMLRDPAFSNLYFDISWTEVAKYLVGSPEATKISAELINRYPDRFLFGTDEVAPASQEQYLKIYVLYDPLWNLLTKDASEKVRKNNYERLFGGARTRVRAWERANLRVQGSSKSAPQRGHAIGRAYLAAAGYSIRAHTAGSYSLHISEQTLRSYCQVVVWMLALGPLIVCCQWCSAQDQQDATKKEGQINVNWLYGSYVPKEVPLQSLNTHQRFQLYVRQTYTTWGIYVKTTLFAVSDQSRGTYPQWGQGFSGFAKRWGTRQGQFIVQNSVSFLGNGLLRWEPRYDRCRCSGLWPRTRHAIVRNFVTYDRSEKSLRPQLFPYVGAFVGSVVSTTWQPDSPRWQVKGYQAVITQVPVGIGINWLGEFAPEIVRVFRRSKK